MIKDLLKADGYILVNKKLARILGIDATILLADLISKECYFEEQNKLTDEGEFFNTQENIEKDTTLSPYKQGKALKLLNEKEVLSYKRKGVLGTYHFSIDYDSLVEILKAKDTQTSKNFISRPKETSYLDPKKLQVNNNNNNNKNNNKEQFASQPAEISSLKEETIVDLEEEAEWQRKKRWAKQAPIQEIFSYFEKRVDDDFGVVPSIARQKCTGMVKRLLNKYGKEKTKRLIDYYLDSDKIKKHGFNLSVALSADTINKWLYDEEANA